jgi:hypothetical protein
MLETLPVGVTIFPGTGIQENLAARARKFGIPVRKFCVWEHCLSLLIVIAILIY